VTASATRGHASSMIAARRKDGDLAEILRRGGFIAPSSDASVCVLRR
jgi:hypothetical protein